MPYLWDETISCPKCGRTRDQLEIRAILGNEKGGQWFRVFCPICKEIVPPHLSGRMKRVKFRM